MNKEIILERNNMDAAKLNEMIKEHDGSARAFTTRIGLNHNSFYYASRTDERLDNMSVSMFMKVAQGLDLDPYALALELGYSHD